MSHHLHETGTLFISNQTVYASVKANCVRIKRQKGWSYITEGLPSLAKHTDAPSPNLHLILQFLSFFFFEVAHSDLMMSNDYLLESKRVTIEFTNRTSTSIVQEAASGW